MENVTREVISDLWPLYASGEASRDTRNLVEEFLRNDTEFDRILRDRSADSIRNVAPPSLPPDHELKTLARLKRRLTGPIWLMQLALIFSCMAFGRIVADTSWDVSPRNFIITAAIAFCFWAAFFVELWRGRKSLLIRLR